MRSVLLKMSGEAIIDAESEQVISVERLDNFAMQIKAALEAESELRISIVVGGGNILRGKELEGIVRVKADQMGMLATVINALALQSSFDRAELPSRILTGVEARGVAEPFVHGRAIRHLEKGRILIFAGGTGNPYFTTDTAAALRAREIGANILLMAKSGTDGVYDKDPRASADAVKFMKLEYDELLSRDLQVMDLTAVQLCKEDPPLPIYVFDMDGEDSVRDALLQKYEEGTLILLDRDEHLGVV